MALDNSPSEGIPFDEVNPSARLARKLTMPSAIIVTLELSPMERQQLLSYFDRNDAPPLSAPMARIVERLRNGVEAKFKKSKTDVNALHRTATILDLNPTYAELVCTGGAVDSVGQRLHALADAEDGSSCR